MSKPCTDRIDVDTGSQKVCRGRMTNRVRTHSFGRQPWHLDRHLLRIAFDEGMNTKAGNRSTAAVEKNVFFRFASLDARSEFTHGMRPQRTLTLLIPFALQLDKGMITLRDMSEVQVFDSELSRFIGPGAGII